MGVMLFLGAVTVLLGAIAFWVVMALCVEYGLEERIEARMLRFLEEDRHDKK